MKRKSKQPFYPTLDWDRDIDSKGDDPTAFHFLSGVPKNQNYSPCQEQNNKLFLGNNFHVMTSLLRSLEGKFRLIYADPPFLTGKAYSARIGRDEDSRKPSEWKLTEGYQDSWKNVSSYLNMLFSRLEIMHRLLAPDGTLYLHLDWHASAYAKLILDEIFGPDRFLNEIVWVYHGPSPIRSAFKRKHDTVLVYTKSEDYVFNADDIRIPLRYGVDQ